LISVDFFPGSEVVQLNRVGYLTFVYAQNYSKRSQLGRSMVTCVSDCRVGAGAGRLRASWDAVFL